MYAVQKYNLYNSTPRLLIETIAIAGMVGYMLGHSNITTELLAPAEKLWITDREEKTGAYPDSAAEYFLPQCDLVIITGSSLINKTLPHLLELCENALTILTGPSVPLCPELLDFGLDRIAGMAVTNRTAMHERVQKGLRGSPYGEGMPFLLKRR